jgi:hypothetical protein
MGTARITVNLTQNAETALGRAVAASGRTKTDTVSRALQLYAWLTEVSEGGGQVMVQGGPDQAPQVVVFL